MDVPAASASLRPDVAVPSAPKPSQAPAPNLIAAAEVCAGLARALESSELTALLARAADVLDAGGLIVWLADRSGAELTPVLSHGYSTQALARMGAIPRDAHNAVAVAYRTAQVRTVPGDASAKGAIVAPIVSPGGPLGALAVETRHRGEASESKRALTMIFASQLGTLVGSVPVESKVANVQA
jgi:GAF domain-containing protein